MAICSNVPRRRDKNQNVKQPPAPPRSNDSPRLKARDEDQYLCRGRRRDHPPDIKGSQAQPIESVGQVDRESLVLGEEQTPEEDEQEQIQSATRHSRQDPRKDGPSDTLSAVGQGTRPSKRTKHQAPRRSPATLTAQRGNFSPAAPTDNTRLKPTETHSAAKHPQEHETKAQRSIEDQGEANEASQLFSEQGQLSTSAEEEVDTDHENSTSGSSPSIDGESDASDAGDQGSGSSEEEEEEEEEDEEEGDDDTSNSDAESSQSAATSQVSDTTRTHGTTKRLVWNGTTKTGMRRVFLPIRVRSRLKKHKFKAAEAIKEETGVEMLKVCMRRRRSGNWVSMVAVRASAEAAGKVLNILQILVDYPGRSLKDVFEQVKEEESESD